jgi:divalent metal cation (Fe/Co/Zn/Cd) transporter
MTIHVGANSSLTNAHRIASELEESVRSALPEIADVVVYTEP